MFIQKFMFGLQEFSVIHSKIRTIIRPSSPHSRGGRARSCACALHNTRHFPSPPQGSSYRGALNGVLAPPSAPPVDEA